MEGGWERPRGDADRASARPLFPVQGTTIEALSEALRSDREAKQRAPAGKVLLRQDEMGEWIASFDHYRAGGERRRRIGEPFCGFYNGGRYTIDRVSRGSFAIANWSACVLGGIQPELITEDRA